MSKIVVYGATGYAGSHITAELIRRGHEVVGVSRRGEESAPGATDVAGSIFDDALVETLSADADHIVVALPAAPRSDEDAPLVDALPRLIASAVSSGARIGVVGGAGSLAVAEGGPRLVDTPEFPADYKPEALAHGDVLDTLRASDTALDWFYVSPAATFGAWNAGERTGSFRLGGDLLLTDAEGVSAISGADYAIAFVDEIEHGAHPRARFCVAY